MGILEKWRITDLEVTGEMLAAWSVEKEIESQVNRLVAEARVCIAMQAIPRRLGAEATPKELARDKQLARRICHVMMRNAALWYNAELRLAARLVKRAHELGPVDKRMGAQRVWTAWDSTHHTQVEFERSRVATFALAAGERQFGNRAAHLLTKEQEETEYAFR